MYLWDVLFQVKHDLFTLSGRVCVIGRFQMCWWFRLEDHSLDTVFRYGPWQNSSVHLHYCRWSPRKSYGIQGNLFLQFPLLGFMCSRGSHWERALLGTKSVHRFDFFHRTGNRQQWLQATAFSRDLPSNTNGTLGVRGGEVPQQRLP